MKAVGKSTLDAYSAGGGPESSAGGGGAASGFEESLEAVASSGENGANTAVPCDSSFTRQYCTLYHVAPQGRGQLGWWWVQPATGCSSFAASTDNKHMGRASYRSASRIYQWAASRKPGLAMRSRQTVASRRHNVTRPAKFCDRLMQLLNWIGPDGLQLHQRQAGRTVDGNRERIQNLALGQASPNG